MYVIQKKVKCEECQGMGYRYIDSLNRILDHEECNATGYVYEEVPLVEALDEILTPDSRYAQFMVDRVNEFAQRLSSKP